GELAQDRAQPGGAGGHVHFPRAEPGQLLRFLQAQQGLFLGGAVQGHDEATCVASVRLRQVAAAQLDVAQAAIAGGYPGELDLQLLRLHAYFRDRLGQGVLVPPDLVYRHPPQLLARPAQEHGAGWIGVEDLQRVQVDGEHRVGVGLEQLAVPVFRRPRAVAGAQQPVQQAVAQEIEQGRGATDIGGALPGLQAGEGGGVRRQCRQDAVAEQDPQDPDGQVQQRNADRERARGDFRGLHAAPWPGHAGPVELCHRLAPEREAQAYQRAWPFRTQLRRRDAVNGMTAPITGEVWREQGVEPGAIASLLQHPIESALLVLDADGRPVAANPAAQAMALPDAAARYASLLQDLRASLSAGERQAVACSLPGPERRLDGWLRGVRGPDGGTIAYTL